MERIFVDTAAWYALADSADPDHKAAVKWFEENNLPLLTTNYIFAETVT